MCKKVVNVTDTNEEFLYIGRPSKWGNPFTHLENSLAEFKVGNREEAIKKYEEWITKGDGKYLLDDLHELKGLNLGCWCHPKSCHGDILIKLYDDKFNNTELF